MIKRILICTLCFMLCLSVCVFAEEVADTPKESVPQQGERIRGPGGGMGGFYREVPPTDGQQPPEITIPDNGNMPRFEVEDKGNMPTIPQSSENTDVTDGENTQQPWGGMQGGRGQFGTFPGMQQDDAQVEQKTSKTFKDIVLEYLTPIISVVLLAIAFVFVIFYKRKTY